MFNHVLGCAGHQGAELRARFPEVVAAAHAAVLGGADQITMHLREGHLWSDGHPFTIGDAYQAADLVTFPSTYEGFGNAFLEAVYFKKPLLINRYTIFVRDIEPKEFDLIAMDGYLTGKSVQKVIYPRPHTRRR